jgi:hypothetical protein
MRQALAKKLFAGSITAVTALLLGILPAAPAFAQAFHPTMQIMGGDVSAGGWFGNSCQTSAPYQDAAYTVGGINDNSAGGIYTYTGTSGQYAAYAMGKIDNTGGAPNGFATSAATGGAAGRLGFANFNYLGGSGYVAGNWDGGIANISQCIPDYYKDKMPASGVNSLSDLNAMASGAYTADGTGSPVNLAPGVKTIGFGKDISVFVKGNVYIGSNIVYQPGYNVAQIPRFALVATGNIYVGPGVTQLDGLYIAQPDNSTNLFSDTATVNAKTGEFWTCHNQDPNQLVDKTFFDACSANTLTVNGSVIAKRVNLMRVNGSNAAREFFNYNPAMVLAGPFFPGSQSNSGTINGQPSFDRIISLPPVF